MNTAAIEQDMLEQNSIAIIMLVRIHPVFFSLAERDSAALIRSYSFIAVRHDEENLFDIRLVVSWDDFCAGICIMHGDPNGTT